MPTSSFLTKAIIQIYVLLMPFTSAFALSSVLPLYVLLMIITLVYVVISFQLKFFNEDWEMLMIIVLGIVAFAFSYPFFGSKNANHLASFIGSFLLFFVVPKSLLVKFKSINTFSGSIALALALVSAFVIVEFVGSNYFGINFLDLIPYVDTDLGEALVIGQFVRPRGFAAEAGHAALFYELAIPLSFLYFKNKHFFFKVLYYLPVFASFILLFSSASFVSISIALITYIFLFQNLRSTKTILLLVITSFAVISILSSSITAPFLEGTVGTRFATAFDSGGSDISTLDRLDRYRNAFSVSSSYPFGIGWGMTSQLAFDKQQIGDVAFTKAGVVSLYLEILVSSGFMGLVLFIKFSSKKIVQLTKSNSIESQMVFLSSLSLLLHYLFLSNYWFPVLWFSLALADTVISSENKLSIKNSQNKNFTKFYLIK